MTVYKASSEQEKSGTKSEEKSMEIKKRRTKEWELNYRQQPARKVKERGNPPPAAARTQSSLGSQAAPRCYPRYPQTWPHLEKGED